MFAPACRGRVAGIAAGYLADVLFGDPRRGHPVALFGSGAAALERLTYADSRSCRGAAHRGTARGARRARCRRRAGRAAARTGVDGRGHRGGDVRRARRNVVEPHRPPDGRPAGRRRRRGRPATVAVAVRTRPGRARLGRAGARGTGIGRREHLRRAGGARAVGRGRRGARGAGVPRRQHAGRDDRPPVAALCPIRLGCSTFRRRRQLRRGSRHRRAGGGVRACGRRIARRERYVRGAATRPVTPAPTRVWWRRPSRARSACGSAARRSTHTNWRSGRRSATGERRRSRISLRAVRLSRIVQAAVGRGLPQRRRPYRSASFCSVVSGAAASASAAAAFSRRRCRISAYTK